MEPVIGTWPWIVAGLVSALTGVSALYNKHLLDRIRTLETAREVLMQKWEKALAERYESEMEVVKLLGKATEVIESAVRRLPPASQP